MEHHNDMNCPNARALVPSYLDGELSQAQAGPLRQHLLDCQACRASAQDQKNLKRWFVPGAEIAVPGGFAARVARRAFQGDTGERLEPALPGGSALALERESQGRLLRFVLACTAAAAALLFALSIGVRQLGLPSSDRMLADDKAPVQLDRALEELDRINRAEQSAPLDPQAPASRAGRKP